MTIKINEQWRIETEPLNYMLQKSRVIKEGKKEGQRVWDTIGYYPTLELAYKALTTKGLASEDLQGIDEIVDYLLYIHEDIKRSLTEVAG